MPGHCTDQLGLQDARQSTTDPGAVLEHDPKSCSNRPRVYAGINSASMGPGCGWPPPGCPAPPPSAPRAERGRRVRCRHHVAPVQRGERGIDHLGHPFRPRRGPTVHTPAVGPSFCRRWRRSVPAAWAVTTSPLASQALGMSRPASRLRRPGVNEHPGAQHQQAPWAAAGVTQTLVCRASARPGRSTRRCWAVRRAVGRQAHPFRGSVVQ